MMIGQIHPTGVAHTMDVHAAADGMTVYTTHHGHKIRVAAIPHHGDTVWDNGWGADDPAFRTAVAEAVTELTGRVVRGCDG